MSTAKDDITLLITEDKLKAFVTVRTEEATEVLKRDFLEKLLQEKKVKHGIDQNMLDELIKNPRPGTYVIAAGKPARNGKDGYVQYLFSAQKAHQNAEDVKNIDFREIFNVPSVNANSVLAVYHPAEKGENGVAVTGEAIPCRKVVELNLRAGNGAALSKDGRAVTSTISGRPWVQKRGKHVVVGVDAVYRHDGDVDIKSGNLRFNGDVTVSGNVTENMIVDITGNLKVFGFISRATVNVGGNLEVVKVITAGKVTVGGEAVYQNKIKQQLTRMKKTIDELDAMARQIMGRLNTDNNNVQYGQVIMTLLDKKFPLFGKQVQELFEHVQNREQQLPAELINALQAIKAISGINALKIKSLHDVQESITEAVKYLDTVTNSSANVIVNSIWNSEIEATGDINITGQGAFNSFLTALGTINIKGVFRGGELVARGNVQAGEIGAPMGVKTLVRTSEGGTIKAKRVYNGTILQIGTRVYPVREDRNMVLARINENGDIILH